MRHLSPEQHADRLAIWRSMSATGASWHDMAKAAGVHNASFREWANKHLPEARGYRERWDYSPATVAGRIERGVKNGEPVWRIARAARMTVEQLRAYAAEHKLSLPQEAKKRPAREPIPDAKFYEPRASKMLPPHVVALRARIWHNGRTKGHSWKTMAQAAGISLASFQEWVFRNIPEVERTRAPPVLPREARPPKTERKCLGCGETFPSEGAHNRLCHSCSRRVGSPFEPDFGREARRASSHRA